MVYNPLLISLFTSLGIAIGPVIAPALRPVFGDLKAFFSSFEKSC